MKSEKSFGLSGRKVSHDNRKMRLISGAFILWTKTHSHSFYSLSILCALNKQIKQKDCLDEKQSAADDFDRKNPSKASKADLSLSKQLKLFVSELSTSRQTFVEKKSMLSRNISNFDEEDLKLLNIPSRFQCVVKFINCNLWI